MRHRYANRVHSCVPLGEFSSRWTPRKEFYKHKDISESPFVAIVASGCLRVVALHSTVLARGSDSWLSRSACLMRNLKPLLFLASKHDVYRHSVGSWNAPRFFHLAGPFRERVEGKAFVWLDPGWSMHLRSRHRDSRFRIWCSGTAWAISGAAA